ncbi:glycosyltransferase [Gordonia desulfuricans]|uniref:glycosyltransferase n=1 Tax=Gordonia desulfuricans TaxID=89051 RepID=UPI000AD87649|nr:nucleotide disphospho-sugar-binding domain-containing protein [Gordonia desulfuricans]
MSPAHIVFLLYGSRGDIQPGICLATELLRRGHRVTAVVPPNLVDLVASAGVPTVYPVGRDTDRQWSSDTALDAQRSRNPLTKARFALDTVVDGIRSFDDGLIRLFVDADPTTGKPPVHDVDRLVVAPICQARGMALADRLGVVLTVLRFAPMSPNSWYGPVPGVADGLGPRATRAAWRAYNSVVWSSTRHGENRFRRRIGLATMHRPCPDRLAARRIVQIQAYDPAIVPGLGDEWGSLKPIIGFLDLAAQDRRHLTEVSGHDTDLTAWLADGSAPVYVGFGSMPIADPDRISEIFCSVAAESGLRLILALGGRPGRDPQHPDVYHVGAVDHSWLFPQCAVVVHHGGAGTTAAVLRSGTPGVIYAFTAEQPFWANRIAALGVGVGRRFSALSRETVGEDLRVVIGDGIRDAAREFAAQMVTPQQAVATAAELVEERSRALATP